MTLQAIKQSIKQTPFFECEDGLLYCADCMDILPQLPDKSIALCLTDPPYGIDYQSAWRTDKGQWKPKIANDKEPFIDWIGPVYRPIKEGGRLVCFERWDVEDVFRHAIESAGFAVKSQIIWDKVVHGMGDLKGEFAPCHENALYATKGRYEFNGLRPKTILRHMRVMPELLIHPNEKPVSLAVEIIQRLTVKGELVADLFAGSGSVAVACIRLGRKFIGIEISEEYCRIAKDRIQAAQKGITVAELKRGQKVLF
jgi:DNA modification methylase